MQDDSGRGLLSLTIAKLLTEWIITDGLRRIFLFTSTGYASLNSSAGGAHSTYNRWPLGWKGSRVATAHRKARHG
jgi:hypothetical protein